MIAPLTVKRDEDTPAGRLIQSNISAIGSAVVSCPAYATLSNCRIPRICGCVRRCSLRGGSLTACFQNPACGLRQYKHMLLTCRTLANQATIFQSLKFKLAPALQLTKKARFGSMSKSKSPWILQEHPRLVNECCFLQRLEDSFRRCLCQVGNASPEDIGAHRLLEDSDLLYWHILHSLALQYPCMQQTDSEHSSLNQKEPPNCLWAQEPNLTPIISLLFATKDDSRNTRMHNETQTACHWNFRRRANLAFPSPDALTLFLAEQGKCIPFVSRC